MLPLFSKFVSVGEKFVSVGATPTDREITNGIGIEIRILIVHLPLSLVEDVHSLFDLSYRDNFNII